MASQDKTGQLLCIVQFTTKFFKKEVDSLQDFYLSLFFWDILPIALFLD